MSSAGPAWGDGGTSRRSKETSLAAFTWGPKGTRNWGKVLSGPARSEKGRLARNVHFLQPLTSLPRRQSIGSPLPHQPMGRASWAEMNRPRQLPSFSSFVPHLRLFQGCLSTEVTELLTSQTNPAVKISGSVHDSHDTSPWIPTLPNMGWNQPLRSTWCSLALS